MSLLSKLNHTYSTLHVAKEEAFWVDKMGLPGKETVDFLGKEIALKEFSSSAENLAAVRAEMEREDLSEEEQIGLKGWERYFSVNQIEGEEARGLFRELVEKEGALEKERGEMRLGYTDPESNEFIETSSVALSLKIRTEREEALRKAAFEGMRSIEPFVLENGYIEVVKLRNRLAHALGYKDYYDWKVSINEGFGKDELFTILDDLEERTREVAAASVKNLETEYGSEAIKPWNHPYYTSGDLTAEIDPYFPFAESFTRWIRSFDALNIDYSGATLQLDLVDRRGKYSNGFMHGASPAWVESGELQKARINFTANAVPGQVGSGERATQTFFHEGGHAAHFANIRMPAPCYGQEYAPTSVAMAETQSMFLDSFLKDADWLARYGKNSNGESVPVELIKKNAKKDQTLLAWRLRSMLSVCYAEKEIYEMAPEDLTPESIIGIIRDVEQRMLFMECPRPILSVPHLLSGEASAYYHGYILAEMAVYQTREYFLKKYGFLTDNPAIGPELRESYWQEGNARTFLQFVERLTGEPFSAEATARVVARTLEETYEEIDRMVAEQSTRPMSDSAVDLNGIISVVHGEEKIASTADGLSLEEVGLKFKEWVEGLEG